MEVFRWAQRSWSLFIFDDPPSLAFVLFMFSFSFRLDGFVLLPSQHLSSVVSGVCYINIAGRKPISRERDLEGGGDRYTSNKPSFYGVHMNMPCREHFL